MKIVEVYTTYSFVMHNLNLKIEDFFSKKGATLR